MVAGVRLDVTEASGQVSVNGSISGGNAFFTGDSNRVVISAIEAPLMIPEKGITAANVNPLGGTGTAIFTAKEGFTNAIMHDDGNMVTLTVRGIPNKATLTVALGEANEFPVVMVGEKKLVRGMDAVAASNGDPAVDAVPEVTHKVTSTGENIVVTLTLANDLGADGEMGGVDENMDDLINNATSESLSLELRLNAGAKTKGLVLPLTGSADAWYAMAPDTKFVPSQVGGDVFTFKPATCSLMFPYGLVHSAGGFNTGITVSNTSRHAGNAFDGGMGFTFYGSGAEDSEGDPLTLMTGPDHGGNFGLNDDGELSAGNTFTILLSEALALAGHDDDFTGHFVIKSSFTPCVGLGWVTDFMTVNQAYVAMTPQ